MTEEDTLDVEENELIITSHGDSSMDAFETSIIQQHLERSLF